MEYLTKRQTMDYLKLSKTSTRSLANYIAAGLPVIKVGKSIRFSKSDIDKFMQDHTKVNA